MNRSIPVLLLVSVMVGCGQAPPTVDLSAAAMDGNLDAIQQHVDYGSNLDMREQIGGGTPLMAAAVTGQTESARMLIANGASLDLTNNDGSTALMTAAFFCYPETVTLLLDAGADPNIPNNTGDTPLDVVAVEWSAEMEGIYRLVAGILQIPVDLERIQSTRDTVATVLRSKGARRGSEG